MNHVTRFLRRLPIRRKLVLLTLLTSSVALLLSATVFTIYPLSAGPADLVRHGLVGAGVILATFFLALLLSRRIRGEISTPIQNLAERARRISRDQDYSACTLDQRDDELGDLLTAFNDLVNAIHQRDVTELEQAREAVETVERAKSRFLANISHEIRTPITAVLAMTKLLQGTDLSVNQARYVEIVRNSGDSLLHLIDDILELSWLDSGRVALDSLDFDLYLLVEQLLDLFTHRAHGKSIELCSLIESDVPRYLRGDPGRLRRVLINLLGNAVKFTDRGEAHLRVEVASDGHTERGVLVRFTVKDTGIGVPEALRAKLFAPFVQGDYPAKRRHGGSGVGLALSRFLVALMEGEIGLDSEAEGGSSFWFTARLEIIEGATGDESPSAADWRGARALVVDDNDVARGYLAQQLRQLGLHAEEAKDGRTALTMLRGATIQGNAYRLAFIDYSMPGMNGMGIVRAVRSDHRLRDIRLALMTSLSDSVDNDALGRAAIDAQLAKPLKQSGLEAAIELMWSASHGSNFPAPAVSGMLAEAWISPEEEGEPRILVAEDDPEARESMTLMLSSMGYVVDTASNGSEALEAASGTAYDLILMDCQMQDIDGYEATCVIRHLEGETRHVPIVGIMRHLLESDRDRCLAAGMDDCLTKPIPRATLAAVVERRLSK